MSDLSQRIAALSPALLELLAQRLRARAEGRAAETPRIPRRRAPHAHAPLSLAQQRLWFLDQLEPGNPFYNIPAAVELRGPLDRAALARSFQEVVRRHESLRTTFSTSAGSAVQIVAPELSVELPYEDLSALAPSERNEEARRVAAREARTPFDLARGPLLRARLLRLDSEAHILLVTMHHIVSDGWSMGVLVRELVQLYGAFAEGRPGALPELPLQYADFAEWQRETLGDERLLPHIAYWRKQLAGASGVLELPTDYPRPAAQTFRGATLERTLPPELTSELQALSRAEGATLFMTLLAAFKLILHHLSRQQDILVGSPVAGRDRSELEPLIGFFANILVLRTRVEDGQTFRRLLAAVRETTLAAHEHGDVPFDRLVEELQPARDPARTPLFQVAFTLQNETVETFNVAGLRVSPFKFESDRAQFDIVLNTFETPAGLRASAEYNTALFSASTVARFLSGYEAVLRFVAARPEARLAKVGESLREAESEERRLKEKELEQAGLLRLKKARRKSVGEAGVVRR